MRRALCKGLVAQQKLEVAASKPVLMRWSMKSKRVESDVV